MYVAKAFFLRKGPISCKMHFSSHHSDTTSALSFNIGFYEISTSTKHESVAIFLSAVLDVSTEA